MGVFEKLVFAMVFVLCQKHVWSEINYFSANDMQGVQDLWAAWNTSTPDPSTNLPGWHSTRGDNTDYPCWNQKSNWQGVSCLTYISNHTSRDSNAWIVGLTLDNASINGILPPGISNFSYLVTLSLTGNPNLTGNLPKELGGLPLNTLDLHDNNFNGTIPEELSSLYNLQTLDLSGNQFTGQFPTQFGQSDTLQKFSIARNQFSGEIPRQAFENQINLVTLDLSQNEIGGVLPNFSMLLRLKNLYLDDNAFNGTLDITELSQLFPQYSQSSNSTRGMLEVLSLKNNKFTEVKFDQNLVKDVGTTIYLQGNPYCNDSKNSKDDGVRCYCEQLCLPASGSSIGGIFISWVVVITAGAFAMFMIVFMILFSSICDQQSKKRMKWEFLKKIDEANINPIKFNYNTLLSATKNFDDDMILGAGGFGVVYKGILSNNNVIAVKQLFMKTQQASIDFINEIVLITNLQHRNLVKLRGYCLNGKVMLLVYDYIDNADLGKILLDAKRDEQFPILDWPARYKICLGVAEGLHYLHASTQPKIIHRDIKASNILLDKNLNPKIADFGLARQFIEEESHIMTDKRVGTRGYLAPEYLMWGQLSEKADIYSFGVLLLEIVSGRQNIDTNMQEEEVYLPNLAWRLQREDKLLDLVDPQLHMNNLKEQMEVRCTLETALMCIQTKPKKRPNMLTALSMLLGESNISVVRDDSREWIDGSYLIDIEESDESKELFFNNSFISTTSLYVEYPPS